MRWANRPLSVGVLAGTLSMEVVSMASAIEVKNIDKPDERRDFPHGHLELSAIGDATLGR